MSAPTPLQQFTPGMAMGTFQGVVEEANEAMSRLPVLMPIPFLMMQFGDRRVKLLAWGGIDGVKAAFLADGSGVPDAALAGRVANVDGEVYLASIEYVEKTGRNWLAVAKFARRRRSIMSKKTVIRWLDDPSHPTVHPKPEPQSIPYTQQLRSLVGINAES